MTDFTPIISFITESEANALANQLRGNGIRLLINKHGAASRIRSYYFEIKVASDDVELAMPLVNQFKRQSDMNKNNCPNCGSSFYESLRLQAFLKEFFLLEQFQSNVKTAARFTVFDYGE